MQCIKCGAELVPGAAFCHMCGKKISAGPAKKGRPKQRGNGQGTVFQLPNGKYKATVILGYYLTADGKQHRRTRSRVFDKKKDAVNALAKLREDPKKEVKKTITFKQLYELWLPTHRAGKSTLDCYKAASKYFEAVYPLRMSEIDVDDLQDCIDTCPHGRRTKENMRALAGLMYKYGIPRHVIPDNLNLAPFLLVDGDGAAHRSSFTDVQLEQIRRACGVVPGAEDIYCMCYLGFRPSEYLALTADSYDKARNCLVGGSKTKAGKDRAVTISPKIEAIVGRSVASGGYLCKAPDGGQWDLQDFTEKLFYPALEKIGIDNPIVEIGGGKMRHKYTPHSCRHTFSTLMKRVAGADKDKLALMGHTSGEMLRYYQDAPVDDLRKITDVI